MDISESPTQANDGRDYETARHHSLDPDPEPVTSSFHDEPHTFLDDDTGAVVFGSLSQDAKVTSPLSDNLSPVDVTARSGWRDQSQHDVQATPARQVAAPPQTPAPVSNPFIRQGHTSVLRATQLFNATQLSSAGKGFSPTSSRPSPHTFHQGFGFLNSTSPADLGTSPLKNRFAMSSPLRAEGGTSPGPPAGARSPQERSLYGEQGDEDAVESIPESPPGDDLPPRKRRRQELLEDYEPLAASQQRKLLNESINGAADSDDSDGDGEYQRRLQARRSRERAERRVVGISLDLPKKGEMASRRAATQRTPTGRLSKRWRGYERRPSSPRARSVNLGAEVVPDDDLPPTQIPEQPPPAELSLPQHNPEEGNGLVDGIPGTSSPPLITAHRVISQQRSEELPSAASSNSVPTRIPQSSQRTKHKRGQSDNAIPESPIAVPESDYTQGAPASDATRQSSLEQVAGTGETPRPPPDLPPTQPPTQPPLHPKPVAQPETSLKPTIHNASSAAQPDVPPPASPASSSSQLTALSATPSPVASPTTMRPSPEVDWYASSAAFELPAPRSRRPVKKTYSRPLRKSLPRSLRSRESPNPDTDAATDSHDELIRTPVRKPRASRSLRRESLMPDSPDELQGHSPSRYAHLKALHSRFNGSHGPNGGGLFENMAFAISFQERRDGESAEEYAERCRASEDLAGLVTAAGGRVLRHGFSELLDPSEDGPGVELRGGARGLGFTALLADGHSRKVKFMQALALGLPCLAYQWATASLEREEVQEWGSYLLCAGQSVPRGNALLSRSLVPYPAGTAKLEDVVAGRKLLLGGQRILLVMKAREGEGMAYVVLARIVGAEITRVRSAREGRKALRKGGFEWVYGDEGGSFGKGEGGGMANGEGEGQRARCLSNELIIQSLIAGRVIDEGERVAYRI